MKLIFLGTGTSQGIPTIGCRCEVCSSTDSRDKRLRTSALVEVDGTTIVIDAGPDFRAQMLREGVRKVDGILLTHEHKDHIGGIDDVRALNFVDYPTIRPTNIYATHRTLECVRKDFDYAFGSQKYQGVPEIILHKINHEEDFTINDVSITPIKGGHSDRFEVTGYRFGDLAYLTDFKTIDDRETAKLSGVKTLIVNALRFTPHHSHFNVDEALELIKRVAPERAYLTHISHDAGLYCDFAKKLPAGVIPAYDGLVIEEL
ncbi:MAG: MBL fold metallo-hydrolase [Rikenellaceae bacterium]